MKTNELTGAALDWAVAKCEDEEVTMVKGQLETRWTENGWKPSTDWAQGGPIIEREGLGVSQYNNIPDRPENRWQCVKYYGGMRLGNYRPLCEHGPTPLIAAMRCYVASKLGDEVDVPTELI